MSIAELQEAFELLDPYQKAAFIDARLAWTTNGALCEEVKTRLCKQLIIDN